ncbi:hypothetical protein PoB_003202900 [Plakobranchus ocellatus]|uniref:Uncharacterized protein n=1 Tax=Plakobranchus ocellatus TaxID=259542 RepID=A0AAV4AD02_9GAST|nr:hypothetical protein PoB_003202900 [Plakobranchus ocellatus]
MRRRVRRISLFSVKRDLSLAKVIYLCTMIMFHFSARRGHIFTLKSQKFARNLSTAKVMYLWKLIMYLSCARKGHIFTLILQKLVRAQGGDIPMEPFPSEVLDPALGADQMSVWLGG